MFFGCYFIDVFVVHTKEAQRKIKIKIERSEESERRRKEKGWDTTKSIPSGLATCSKYHGIVGIHES
jgi:hypothetical protein